MSKINDLYRFKFFGHLKACGSTAIFVQAEANEKENKYDYSLIQYTKGLLKQITFSNTENNFIFKDENTILFCGNREKEDDQTLLYELSLEGGEAKPIYTFKNKKINLIEQMEDGSILMMENTHLEKEEEAWEIFDEIPFYFNGAGIINKHRDHLILFKDGKIEELNETLENVSLVKSDGKTIYALKETFETKSSLRSGLYSYSLSKKKWTPLIPAETYTILDFAISQNGLYAFMSDNQEFGLNQNPDLYFIGCDGQVQLKEKWGYSLGNTVGTDCALVGGNNMLVREEKLYYTTTKEDHVALYVFDGKKSTLYYEMNGTIQAFAFAENDLLWIGASNSNLQELYLYDGKVNQISHFNELSGFVAQPKEIYFQDHAGEKMKGWILYPANFNETKQYPGILDIHGGPKTVYGTIFYHEMQVWAEEGYFVFFTNPHGSDGKDDQFADIRGKYGTIDYEDLMCFVDALLKQIPQIDPKALGVTGGSYGGFMTNWIIGHTNRFKVAASQRSISNWISFSQTSDIGPYFTKDQQGAAMDEDVDALWTHSPLKYAKNVTTPTLFIHSDEDYRCPSSEGIQMLNALLDRGIEARMCLFHKENHELSRSGRPKNRIKRLEEITNWMNQHLKNH